MPYLLLIILLVPQLLYAQSSTHFFSNNEKQAPVIEISVLTDKSGKKTLTEVIAMQSEFKVIKQSLNNGYTQSAYWFRIIVQRPANTPNQWVLSASPAFLDNLRFFSKEQENHYQMQQAGDLFSAALRPIDKHYGSFSFALNLEDTLSHVYYLRLQTSSTSTLRITVLPANEAAQDNTLHKLVLGLILGIFLFLFISTLNMWLRSRHISFVVFLGYITVSILGLVFLDGVAQQYLLAHQPELANALPPFIVCSLLFLSSLLFILFFNTAQHFPYLHKLLCAILALITLAIFSSPLELYSLIAPVVLLSVLCVALPTQLYISWHSSTQPQNNSPFIFYGVLAYTAIFVLMLLAGLGVISPATFPSLQFQVTLLVLLIFIALQQQSKKQVPLFTKENLESNSTFLNLIAHEIKTPLAVIESSVQVLEAQHNLDNDMIRERHHRIRNSVSNLNLLLDNTFLNERFSTKPLEPRVEYIELEPVITKVIKTKFACHRFKIEISKNLYCLADPVLLKLALSNLIDNAIKFSPTESIIALTAIHENTDDGILINITNTYIAKNKPNPEQWFNKYYQSKNNAYQEGLGLGLYMVKKIVQALAGGINPIITPQQDHWLINMRLWLPDTNRPTDDD